MKNTDLKSQFFFEMPLSDVYASCCAAFSLIYYGTRRGQFSMLRAPKINMSQVEAIKISLVPRGVNRLTDDNIYSIVYYRKKLAKKLWGGFERWCNLSLKRLTRRVKYSGEQTLLPTRLKTFYIKSDRPIYIARYEHRVPVDYAVPVHFVNQIKDEFEGFLMCSHGEITLENSLFPLQGLKLIDYRSPKIKSRSAPHVLLYTLDPSLESF